MAAEMCVMYQEPHYDQQVLRAQTADDIVWAARDFVARWTPEELSHIPPHLRPRKLVDAEDVNAYALELVQQQQFTMDPRTAPQLHRMANFFSTASHRLAMILGGNA
jgi:hypothetical protein